MTAGDLSLQLREAQPDDVETIFGLIQELADYEQLSDQVAGSAELLETHLFGAVPYARVILAEYGPEVAGFALYFFNYSTFLTRPGLYLEDLYVRPAHRGRGVGRALLVRVAAIAVEQGCGRVDWSVLDWNEPAVGFYQKMGATVFREWRICRLTGEALHRLGSVHP